MNIPMRWPPFMLIFLYFWWWRIPPLVPSSWLICFCSAIFWYLCNNSSKLDYFLIILFLDLKFFISLEFLANMVKPVSKLINLAFSEPRTLISPCPLAKLISCSTISWLITCSPSLKMSHKAKLISCSAISWLTTCSPSLEMSHKWNRD